MSVKITIIGLDALGQSLALALKNSEQALTITGHDRERDRMSAAEQAQVADRVEWNLIKAIEGANLIFVNEPPHQVGETLALIGEELTHDVVVTDTGSHKGALAGVVAALPPNVHFIPGTPFASPEGVDPLAFQKQKYALLPAADVPEAAVRLLTNAVGLLGAEPLFMEPEEHDVLMAALVSLPAMTGVALLNLVARSGSRRDLGMMADAPFHNATRFPYEEAEPLAQLLRQSREPLLRWLAGLETELARLRALIEQEDDGTALSSHLEMLLAMQRSWVREGELSPEGEQLAKSLDEAKEISGFRRFLGSFGSGRR